MMEQLPKTPHSNQGNGMPCRCGDCESVRRQLEVARNALQQFADCDLDDENCASVLVACRRVRHTAKTALANVSEATRNDLVVAEGVTAGETALELRTQQQRSHGRTTTERKGAAGTPHQGVTLPVGEKSASKCHNGLPHYCPNCDRSFDDILAAENRRTSTREDGR